MPSINMITTTAGRAAILAAIAGPSNLVVDDVQISDTNQAVGIGTTALTNVVRTVSVTGSVREAGDGHALHIVVTDDSTNAYSVRALAVRLDDGTYLMVHSQSALIATKAADAALLLSFDLTIDADTAATITFGNTDFALPAAGEESPGIVELASKAEVAAGTDALRAITPLQLARRTEATEKRAVELAYLSTLATKFTAADIAAVASSPDSDGAIVVCRATTTNQVYEASSGLDTFTARAIGSASASPMHAAAYGGVLGDPRFVVAGVDEIHSSSDGGVAWTRRLAGAGATFLDGIWSETLARFLFVGSNGKVCFSLDGDSWSTGTAGSGFVGTFYGVCEHGNKAFACGSGGEIQFTTDGATWQRVATGAAFTLETIQSTPYGIVALPGSGTEGRISVDDGESFTAFTIPTGLGGWSRAALSRTGLGTFGSASGDGWFIHSTPLSGSARRKYLLAEECMKLVRTEAYWVGWTAAGEVFVSQQIPVDW